MEKTCAFCGALRPVVYCEADAAMLCLACDSKVHSANALFARHSRTLLCDSCHHNPASFRCLDLLMLLCQHCEPRLHPNNLNLGSFTGCPAANHFATLWGFDFNDLQLQFFQSKKFSNHQEEQNKSLILHQILELKNLQENNKSSSLLNHTDYATSGIIDEISQEQQSKEQLNSFNIELQSLDNPISLLDHISSSSSSSSGDPFWQCNKSASENNQYWSQNMQDLGRCQEMGCFDDLNMPDVDVSFPNFEELLIADPDFTRALLQDSDPMSSSDFERTSMMETTQAYQKE